MSVKTNLLGENAVLTVLKALLGELQQSSSKCRVARIEFNPELGGRIVFHPSDSSKNCLSGIVDIWSEEEEKRTSKVAFNCGGRGAGAFDVEIDEDGEFSSPPDFHSRVQRSLNFATSQPNPTYDRPRQIGRRLSHTE